MNEPRLVRDQSPAAPHSRAWLRASVLLALLLVGSVAAAQGRIVAIGDVHGSYRGLVEALTISGLINESGSWIGGDATLVQTGDLLDRGLEVREVLDLIMRLEVEAQAAGGRVEVLLGNHEAMNILGIVRDVNPAVFERFADEGSEQRRQEGFQLFKRVRLRRADVLDASHPLITPEIEERWMRSHPAGLIEYVEAFAPDGVYGRWLRQRKVMVRIGGTLFVHGGVSPALADMSLDEINRTAAEQIALFDKTKADLVSQLMLEPFASIHGLEHVIRSELAFAERGLPAAGGRHRLRLHRAQKLRPLASWSQWLVVSSDGPLWFRGAARWEEPQYLPVLETLERDWGITRIVSGHTVQESGQIEARFGGRVILIDTGMLEGVYHGRASALELQGDQVNAVYAGSRRPLAIAVFAGSTAGAR